MSAHVLTMTFAPRLRSCAQTSHPSRLVAPFTRTSLPSSFSGASRVKRARIKSRSAPRERYPRTPASCKRRMICTNAERPCYSLSRPLLNDFFDFRERTSPTPGVRRVPSAHFPQAHFRTTAPSGQACRSRCRHHAVREAGGASIHTSLRRETFSLLGAR